MNIKEATQPVGNPPSIQTSQEEEYITLFCEGDGFVGLYTPSTIPKVQFAQKDPAILQWILSVVPKGHLYQKSDVWSLEYGGRYALPLLEMFSKHVVGKSFVDKLNPVLKRVALPSASQHPLTFSGFIGFWDAEGTSNYQPSIILVQKDAEILELTKKLLGFGSVYKFVNRNGNPIHRWFVGGNKARELYPLITKNSHSPSKVKKLKQNFEGPAYTVKRKALRDWIRNHPREVKEIAERRGVYTRPSL